MKKILVLGSTGQIGTALKNDLTKWCEVTFFNRNDLDFANIEPLNTKLKDLKPDFIINSAAYTNVDHAEEFIDKAFQVNSLAVEKLSKLALEDPSTGGNPKKLTLDDMKIMYEYSMSGKLFN